MSKGLSEVKFGFKNIDTKNFSCFCRCFEFEAVIPFDTTVRVAVMDWDMLSGDDLIGETFIDIENRFYSKHRPSCGIQKNYVT